MAVIAPTVTPEETNTCAHAGNTPAMSGLKLTSIARPSEVPTMTELRLSVRSTFERVWTPTRATEANSAREAPPSTGEGIAATTAPAFGSTPSTIMITPAPATTQRDFTRVRRTRPMFCAKQV